MLEPERELTLAESSESAKITANDRFRIMGTMNPGGDYGKKEVTLTTIIFAKYIGRLNSPKFFRCYPMY